MKRVAIHLHTDYSFDSNFSPEQVVAAAQAEGLDVIAITDHNEIEGALRARAAGGVRVIIGEEVSTLEGHLIGLFLRARIEPGMSAVRTIDAIREQGGLVFAPHPFASLCSASLGPATVALADRIDAVEVHNAQNPLFWEDRRAQRFAAERGLVAYAGCDTHICGRLAPAWQEMADFETPEGFLAALARAKLTCGRFGPGYFASMIHRHVRDSFGWRPVAGFGASYRRLRATRPVGT